MSTHQPQLFVLKHQNNGLFSDYYLNEVVETLPEWDETLFAEGKQVFHRLQELRATLQPERLDEAQLEQRWIQPVLRALGHHFAVQVKIRYWEKGHRKPDYMLLASEADAQALTGNIYEPSTLQHVLAVADAKR